MREYLSISNLINASLLASVVTLMSVGRLIETQRPLLFFVPFTFCAMTLVGGAVTAWGRNAGMAGVVTDRRTMWSGIALALLLAVLATPPGLVMDTHIRNALKGAANGDIMNLSYPSSIEGCITSVLWAAGFQTMFFVAAPMSFFTRLINRRYVAIVLCLALRVVVKSLQASEAGITAAVPLFHVLALAMTLVGCLLFTRFGLTPAMVFAAGLELRVVFLATEW